MPYTGPPVVCEGCGASFSRPSSLRRHQARRRCPGRVRVPVNQKGSGGAQFRETTLATRVPAVRRVLQVRTIDTEPRIVANKEWSELPVPVKSKPPKQGYQMPGSAFGALSDVSPLMMDEVLLRSQYHALKAWATRLDAVIGNDRDKTGFEAALSEYNQNFERVRAKRRTIPFRRSQY